MSETCAECIHPRIDHERAGCDLCNCDRPYGHRPNHVNGAGAVGSGVQQDGTAKDRSAVAAIEDTDSTSSPPRPIAHADGGL